MKYMVILCAVAVAFLIVSGCSQIFPPLPSQASPAAQTPVPGTTVTAVDTSAAVVAGTPVPATTSGSSENTVIIQKMAFVPSTITVSVGTLVHWVNKDTVTHSVLFPASAHLSTFALSPGQAFSAKFTTPGVYNYTCAIYSSMQGTVIVTP
ncbi:blue (type 1) copper domain protein [Methanoregula boonei 6A8]|uniref:Blue (Type 1) copper domain protein n=1 Tax=Methanoregula boonei (strain DSM 21154 / JCM 14090 / 6A8) TaxID=456442 RepID=A7IB27_METB6|nr:plastocyanin/azurin family copper-binding protein [Methanoregula boonei]ABS56938.1 blue (type 1) copper domain protein [Methanoregula boonei 6A8]